MSFDNVQVLQAKIIARSAAVRNLDEVLTGEQSSNRVLRDQLTDHEVAMADRIAAGDDHIRWTTWAEARLVGMQMQLREGEQRIDKILGTIVGHESAIKAFKAEIAKVHDDMIKATLTASVRATPTHNSDRAKRKAKARDKSREAAARKDRPNEGSGLLHKQNQKRGRKAA